MNEDWLYPCKMPIKVIGVACDDFEIEVLSIMRKHFPHLNETAIQQNHSRKGNYLSLTINVTVDSREQLAALYADLQSSPLVKTVL